jgi:hypothetical protein
LGAAVALGTAALTTGAAEVALALTETLGRGGSLAAGTAAETTAEAFVDTDGLAPGNSTLGCADTGATTGVGFGTEAAPAPTSLAAAPVAEGVGCSLGEPMPQTTNAPEHTSAPNPIGSVYFERGALVEAARSTRAGASKVGVSAIGFTD